MTELIIVLANVNKSYLPSKKLVVEDFSLEIKKGEFFCLVGPSGCGKTTILKMMAGVENQTSGVVQKPNNISMVFQNGALLPWKTAFENISFGLEMQNKTSKETKEVSKKYLEMMGLSDFSKKYPRELSGGQRQRVGIARALAIEPEILLLDEPFSALDSMTADELHKDLLKIWQETGKTIVMVSHSLEEAVVLSDRVGVMKDGKLKGIVEIKLPRPRKDQGTQFFSAVSRIKKMLVSPN